MKTQNYKTILPAICVPLNEDESINEKELRSYVSWLADFDEIGALVTNGHTGEITSMSLAERAKVTRIVAEEVGDRVMVISGICAEGTQTAIAEARAAQEAGADGILLMPPHIWLRFGVTQEAVINHYQKIAAAIDIGIIIHLYPFGTKAFYPVETLLELAKIPNVKAVKMGTRQQAVYEKDIRILREKAPQLTILTCHDEYLLTSMFPGVDGALIGFAGCIPELICRMWKAVKAKDFVTALEIEQKVSAMSEAIYGVGQPSGEAHARMKYAIYRRGIFSSPKMKEPVLPIHDKEKKQIEAALEKAGLLK